MSNQFNAELFNLTVIYANNSVNIFAKGSTAVKGRWSGEITLISTPSFNTMAGPLEPSDLNPPSEDEVYFKNYIPPARDAIHMPIHVLYMVLASVVIFMTLYAIIGHLMKDLLHDLAGNISFVVVAVMANI